MRMLARFFIVAALTLEARAGLRKDRPRIIAITGSVGKNSTKDAIYEGLAASSVVRRSEKSFNSDIGVPLTILGRPNGWGNPLVWLKTLLEGLLLILAPNHYPSMLVLEVGADRPGDIRRIARWLTPDVAVMTFIPAVPVHVEFFASPEELVREKQYLLDVLRPGGTAILCADTDPSRAPAAPAGARALTFGFSPDADVGVGAYGVNYEEERPAGISFQAHYEGRDIPVTLQGII